MYFILIYKLCIYIISHFGYQLIDPKKIVTSIKILIYLIVIALNYLITYLRYYLS